MNISDAYLNRFDAYMNISYTYINISDTFMNMHIYYHISHFFPGLLKRKLIFSLNIYKQSTL